jgi:hypothetical protein
MRFSLSSLAVRAVRQETRWLQVLYLDGYRIEIIERRSA